METRIDYATIEDAHETGVNHKREVTMVRGLGSRLWDDTGREYIDGAGGFGVANVGHCNPMVVQAIEEQAHTLITCPDLLHNDKRALLTRRLAEVTPDGLDYFFLANSGTEANEAAIKFARVATGRTGWVGAMRAFHGRTMGSLSLTWEKAYREPFAPLVPGVKHVPYNNLEALAAAVDDTTAAVILEVVQGEGGVRPGTPEFLQGARRLCSERGALLIVDEVQTGFGRTGRMFACEHYEVVPDILTMGKSIAGGVPMGATAITSAVRGKLRPGIHGTTFGGNPLACAASLATLQFMEENGLARQAAQKGQYFVERLRGIHSDAIREVRGLGLMVGIECRQKVQPYLQTLMQKGIVALSAGSTVVRFLPPLTIDLEDLDTIVDVVTEVLA
jgi:LysW-gamma-L-lysine/LysW-L-ornithine aminotransferase